MASFAAGAASSAAELAKDNKYSQAIDNGGGVFYPLIVESLGLWTAFSISLLRRTAARTTFRSGVPLVLLCAISFSSYLLSYGLTMLK